MNVETRTRMATNINIAIERNWRACNWKSLRRQTIWLI